ncbi:DUF4352 domain-containing protein [Candidatus Woesearchaeota archaeon]|nr:DUF4352 domain-containing protein [Candidatus Woesearchaeota archaeon]
MKASKENPQIHKLTVGLLLTWGFSIFFGVMGIVALFKTSILSGLALILSCALILPPLTNLIREKYKIELSKGIKFIILILLFIAYGAFVPQSQITASEKPSNATYKIGDRVEIGDFAYTVQNVWRVNEINTSSEIRRADGVFLTFDVSIENIANETKTLWGIGLKVIDEKGRTFQSSYSNFFLNQMQPGLPKRGIVAFDIPPGIKPRLEVSSNRMLSNEKKYFVLS